MGRTVEATCEVCGAVFQLQQGGGFTFNLWCCEVCGKPRAVPLPAPGAPEPGAAPEPCGCGGMITATALPRCPECRSARIKTEKTLLFYD